MWRTTIIAVLAALWVGCSSDSVLPEQTPASLDDDDATDDDDGTDDDDVSGLMDCEPPPVHDPSSDPADCDADGVPDVEQLASGAAVDCDGDGLIDVCDSIDDACASYGDRQFTEYDAGTLPIVISAPHGGAVRPDDVPMRGAATGSSDVNTIQTARALDAALFARTGRHAHLVVCQLHRDYIDCNRSLTDAQDGHPETVRAWHEYHAFIDTAKATAVRQFGRVLYVDLHGLASSRDKIELGYLLYRSQLYEDDARLAHPAYMRRSSFRTLAESNGDFVEVLRGATSLGAHLQAGGFDTVPGPAHPDPGYDVEGNPGNYFNGGYNTRRHGSQSGGPVDGLQIELTWAGVRDSEISRAAWAEVAADGLLAWVETHLALDVGARSLVRLGPVRGRASERGGEAVVPIRRLGTGSSTVSLGWSGSAVEGADLEAMPATVTFGPGEDEVLLSVRGRPDEDAEGPESVTIELLPGDGYNVDPEARRVTVTVSDAQVPGYALDARDALVEGLPSTWMLWRDTCGEAASATVEIAGEADAGDLTVSTVAFGADDAAVELSVEVPSDDGRERVERATVTLTPDRGTDIQWTGRIVDAGDADVLAAFDGRIEGDVLLPGGLDGPSAPVLPSREDGPQPVSGPGFDALRFDGTDDLVVFDDLALPGPFTVAFAFRTDADTERFMYLYGHGNIGVANHLNVYLTGGGTLRTSLRGAGDASDYDALDVAGDLRDGAWHHLAVVVDPGVGVAEVWLDGAQAASAARGGPDFDPGHPIFLGSRWDLSPTRHYAGDIAGVRVVPRALGGGEIADLAATYLTP